MRLTIVTGMSGAGKTTALKMLEDMGFYCVDNLPIPLISKFAQLVGESSGDIRSAALGIDVRSGEELSQLEETLNQWEEQGFPYEILFLDSSDEILIKRYKETRRNHPLAGRDRLDKGIDRERRKLEFLKRRADYILDTSQLLIRELKAEVERIFGEDKQYSNLFVTVLSFGFKFGIPSDADLVFDVRFLPNPYYEDTLRQKTGNDAEVQEFVKQGGTAEVFLEKLYDMMEFLLPHYVQEGKNQLVIAVGCTGGKHRSVTIANLLHERLSANPFIGLKIDHRDIEKDTKVKQQ